MSRTAPCLPGISQRGGLLGVAGAEAGGVGVPVPECASPGRTDPDIRRLPSRSLARRLRVVGHYRSLSGRARL